MWMKYSIYCNQLHKCIAHLATWDLNSRRLKISARALAFNRFLAEVWQSLDKCLSRYWSVSQYCWGILGDLMSLFSTWACSSEFCTSARKSMGPNKLGIIQQWCKRGTLKNSSFAGTHPPPMQIPVVNPNFFSKGKNFSDQMRAEKANHASLKLKQKNHLVTSHNTFSMCW